MKRSLLILVLAICAGLAVSIMSAQSGSRPAASRPVASGPASGPASAPAQPPEEGRAEKLSRARKILQLHRQTIELAKVGKFAQCEPLLKQILQLDATDATAWYNMACVHSRLGRLGQALQCLETSLTHGYADIRHMQRDPDMDPLRELPRYKQILARREEIQRRRADRIHAQLRKEFGSGYICEIDHTNKLVFATNIDRRTLQKLRDYLTAYAKAQWEGLFTCRFEQYVTVVVPSSKDQRFARGRVGGYYRHGARMLLARQIGMVMTHEFTHALHYADQDGMGQPHPIWISEGLATLFESSRLADGEVVPLPNHRLTVLKGLIARKKTLPWNELFNASHREFMAKAMVAYPQARYTMMYLHQRGLLKKWYDAYTDGYADDKSGAKAMEKVFGKPLAEIEADWAVWVCEQESPPLRLAAGAGYIGIRTQGQMDGLRIIQIVPGSGADKAGLAAGDVIVGVDGERMVDSTALIQLVAAHKAGDMLTVEYRRDGEYHTADVTLGKLPAPATRPRPAPASRPKLPASKPATPATGPARKAA